MIASTIFASVLPLLGRTSMLLLFGVLLGYATNHLRADGVSLSEFEAPASCSAEPAYVAPDPEDCEPFESLAPEEDAGTSSSAPAWTVAP